MPRFLLEKDILKTGKLPDILVVLKQSIFNF